MFTLNGSLVQYENYVSVKLALKKEETIQLQLMVSLFLTLTSSFFIPQEGVGPFLFVTALTILLNCLSLKSETLEVESLWVNLQCLAYSGLQ